MTLIALKCPECSGEIQLDDTREFGFCLYCGCKVVLKRPPTTTDSQKDIRGLLVLAADSLESRDWESARSKVEEALLANIDCPDAWYMKALLSWADKDASASDRAISKGKALEANSMGVFTLDDFNRILGVKVTFIVERGTRHKDSSIHLDISGKEYVLQDTLELNLPSGAYEFTLTETDDDGRRRARIRENVTIDKERKFRVKVSSGGISLTPLKMWRGSRASEQEAMSSLRT